jgi:ABC-type transport system involved in multi-copper enzyme maturation permease subunit
MFSSSLFVFGLMVTWITPLWLISVGIAAGTLLVAIAFGILWLVSRERALALAAGVRESILLPLTYLALFLTAFAVLALVLVPGIPYRSLLGAVSRIAAVGTMDREYAVGPSEIDQKLDVENRGGPLRQNELTEFTIEADQPLSISTTITSNIGQTLAVKLVPGKPFTWQKPFVAERDKLPGSDAISWFATNVNTEPVKLKLQAVTDIEFPEVRSVPRAALAVLLLVLGYFGIQWISPKVSAIALTSSKEAMSQPLFYLVMALGAFLLVAFIVIPYNTFGEDVKMLKDSGLTLIMVLAMIVAVWSASVSVSEEVEGRTALTVLSKPVSRRQFILGKFLGVLGPVVVLFIVLGFLFLVTVSYKVVYDSREVAKTEPTWQLCYLETIATLPGLVLAFFETVVLSAISVAISTRLPMLANLIVCATVYVLGHLVPMLVNSSVGKFEIVRFVGQFIATVLPVLDHFNIQAAVAAGAIVPTTYLWMALLYCIVYSSIAMLLGLAMFEDRDLA